MQTEEAIRKVRARRGTDLICTNWVTEAAYRMLQNNLDPEVAEDPQNLVVYGGTGKAARNWECFDKILECLKNLEEDQTLLIQSGKAVGIIRSHKNAPRVLIANSNLVGHWNNWEHFRELEAKGLMMYGQMTAGSWIYIGTQGILQGTYETYLAIANKHFGGTLKGTLNVTAGLGGMGGAQPLAITMNEGVALIAEIDPARIVKRLKTGYLDRAYENIDEAINGAIDAKKSGVSISIAVQCNAVNLLSRLFRRGVKIDTLTDQTSAHDELSYIPVRYSTEEAAELRIKDPETYARLSLDTMSKHVEWMLQLQEQGAITFDYGNNLRGQAHDKRGIKSAFNFPGFVPVFIRPLFCQGKGPFRWVALSGDPEDIYTTDKAIAELFPDDAGLHRWLKLAKEKVKFQGLPARICWLGMGDREKAGLLFNELVRTGKVKAPIVIGRDHLDTGSVASPNRETEAMRDGSDAVADWAFLNAMSNVAGGASWVSIHNGGGVGIGNSQHAGQVTVADGTLEADERISRVLYNDPAIGIMRHADAGYELAIETGEKFGLLI